MPKPERIYLNECADSGVGLQASESWGNKWKCHSKAELFHPGTTEPYYVVEVDGNLLLNGGASLIWECLKGSGSTSTANAKHYFNSLGALGVSTSLTAASSFQKALQGTAKKIKALSAGFPTHTTGSTASTASKITYKSTFTTTEANFAWNEWGVFNRITTGAPQRMLNRKVGALLTKTSAATASLTVTLSLG